MSVADRVVEAEGEHERYRYKREGLRYSIRAGTGTRVLFRVWRERTALIICTELLCAYNDGYFVRSKTYHATQPAGDRSLPADLSEQYWPPTLDELNIAADVDGVRPHHIASYAWPPGRKERYTAEGWAIVLKRAHSGTWPYSIDLRDFGAIPELPADLARPRAQEEGE